MNTEPMMPYAEWCALSPRRAAEYLAKRRGHDKIQQAKLFAILEMVWDEMPPNDQAERRRDYE